MMAMEFVLDSSLSNNYGVCAPAFKYFLKPSNTSKLLPTPTPLRKQRFSLCIIISYQHASPR
jgi:hypothetical protein